MTLITEDGTGLSTAESFASVAAADTRLAAQGMTNWATLTTTEKEQALRRSTAFMEQSYRGRWKGTRLLREQALSWPRYGSQADGWYVPSTEVPVEVVNACIDLAFKAAAGDLNADVTRTVIREKVGPLETEYAPHGPQSTQYRSIDQALAPYLTGGGGSVRLVRA